MMNPDVSDPNWIEGREQVWSVLENKLADRFTLTDLKVIRHVFFGGDFDLSKKNHMALQKKIGVVEEFVFYPYQNPEVWDYYFSVTAKEKFKYSTSKVDKASVYNPFKYFSSVIRFGSDNRANGWDPKTEAEFHYYVHGESYDNSPRTVAGFSDFIPRLCRPAYAVSDCCVNLAVWILFDYSCELYECKWVYLVNYFISCLPYIDVNTFVRSESEIGSKNNLEAVRMRGFFKAVYHFNEKQISKKIKKAGYSKEEIERAIKIRLDFIENMKSRLGEVDIPELQALIARAEMAEFINDK